MKILFLTAEAAPFAKEGGLGDVGGSLPKALRAIGHDVRVVMPAYQNIESGYPGVNPLPLTIKVSTNAGQIETGVFQGELPGSDVPIYFIAHQSMFNRERVYGYEDDPFRFAFFSKAALLLTQVLNWRPDVLHAHDWHTAPAVTWLATAGQTEAEYQGIPSIFTIHNLAHQGKTTWDVFEFIQLQTHSLMEEGFGEVNFMARGIYHATLVNTVSPTYAREIMTPEGGAGMDGLLRYRHNDLYGILNGLDTDLWNPAKDHRLAQTFDVNGLDGRIQNRRTLQQQAGLPQRDDIPLVAMVSRLDWQKGLDITGHVIHLLMNGLAGDAQFIVLGTGAAKYEQMFAQLASYHQSKMTAFLTYSAGFAPQMYAGSDIFLMPSLFEPCGLGQMIAMQYGSVPIVRATGGLVDTVQDGVTGFTFYSYTPEDFWQALERAVYIFNTDKDSWRQIQIRGMSQDFSWQRSAVGYQQLYEWAIARAG